jgi:hypothetical protein
MYELMKDCDAVVSCFGHNLTCKGMFGVPKKLVTQSITKTCEYIKNNSNSKVIKFVLMNTAGNSNRDLKEHISFFQKCVISLLRFILPPHLDNENAADYLRIKIGQGNKNIEWVAVRPDSLLNKEEVSEYKVFSSQTRSAIFNAGETSRINVAHFMTELISNNETWEKWKGQMPVIYNQ